MRSNNYQYYKDLIVEIFIKAVYHRAYYNAYLKSIQKRTTIIRISVILVPLACYVLIASAVGTAVVWAVIAGIFSAIEMTLQYLPYFSKADEINRYDNRCAILIAEIEHYLSLYTNDLVSDEFIKEHCLAMRKREQEISETITKYYKEKDEFKTPALDAVQIELAAHNISKKIVEIQNDVYKE